MTDSTTAPVADAGAQVEALIAGMRGLESARRFSPELLDHVGDMAYNLVRQGRFDDAYRYYGFLTVYQPTETRFLVGQGICARELGRLAEARMMFDMAACLEPEEPAHTLLSAENALMMGQIDDARESLDQVVRFCAAATGHDAVARRAAALLELTADAAGSARQ